jgi:NAD(P)-dependent dehydrogenase (short-subunit alcohol dehydrogenase family)
MNQPLFDGRVAIITGASRGIGATTARAFVGAGAMRTDDCRRTYKELSAKGVTFVQEPSERPHGIEAVFRDDSGNWFSLTQRLTPTTK